MIKSVIPVAAVALIIGLAAGAILFPRTSTLTTTQETTKIATTTVFSSASLPYTVVTFTVVGLQTYVVVVGCTTVLNGTTTTLTEQFGGPTSVTTVYPSSLPPVFIVTLVTSEGESAYLTTQYTTGSC